MKTQLRFALVLCVVLAPFVLRAAQPQYDFGDAPGPFPTLLPAGARHFVTNGPIFGTTIDAELDGQPSPVATGDDIAGAADENGIFLPWGNIVPGVANPVHIRVNGPTGGWVNAWIDFNRNNQWTTNEQIYRNLFLTPGLHMINFPVPAMALAGNTFARFRISTLPGLWFDFDAPNGEVEDYRFTITNRQSRFFNGLQHDADTNSSVSVTPQRFEVHNDGEIYGGAFVKLGQAQGFSFTYSDWNAVRTVSPAVPLTFSTVYRGLVNGESNAVAAVTTLQTTSSNRLLSVNMPWLGNGPLRITLGTLGEDDVTATIANGAAVAVFAEAQDGSGTDNANFSTSFETVNGVAAASLRGVPNRLRVRLPGGVLVTGVVAIAVSPQNLASPVAHVSDVVISQTRSAAAPPDNAASFYIIAEALPFNEVAVRGTGDARLDVRSPEGRVEISNIGSNAVNGLEIGVATAELAEGTLVANFEPIALNNIGAGSPPPAFRTRVLGFGGQELELCGQELELGGQELGFGGQELELGGQELGVVSLARQEAGDAVEVSANFAPLGATQYRVAAFESGALNGSLTSQNGTLALLNGDVRVPTLAWSAFPSTAVRVEFSSAVTLTAPGQSPLTGNAFEFTPHDPTQAMVVVQSVAVIPSNILSATITNLVVVRQQDWGDAPNTYGTLSPTGARHTVVSGLRLGLTVDVEANGIPTPAATGDDTTGSSDENGLVSITPGLVPGSAANIRFAVQGSGLLHAWIDWNRNGVFDASERVIANAPVTTGTPSFPVSVPFSASVGNTFMRVRLNTLSNIPPTGFGGGGEVEDYRVTVGQGGDVNVDVTVTPDPATDGSGVTFTAAATNSGPGNADGVLMALILPSLTITNIETTVGTCAVTPNGSVECSANSLQPNGAMTVTVRGVYNSPGDSSYFTTNRVTVTTTSADPQPGNNTNTLMLQVRRQFDFGDAADPTFQTFLATNGARHVMNAQGLRLGLLVDAELDGQPVNQENAFGIADDDGIFLPWGNIVPGVANPIHIRVSGGGGVLNAWIDFNRNGQWTGSEQIYSVFLPAGLHTINFPVPASAVPGTAWARFRLSTRTNLWFDGPAPDGEVEDYPFTIVQGQGTNFAGLPHEATGNSTVVVESNRLKVVSADGDTRGGVRIGLGKAEGWGAQLNRPIEDLTELSFRGRLNGSNDQLVARAGVVPFQNGLGVWTDMRPKSAAFLQVQMLGTTGAVLRTVTTSNLAVFAISNPGEGIPDVYSVQVRRTSNVDGFVFHTITWAFPTGQTATLRPMTVTTPNGEQITGVKRIVFAPGTNIMGADYLSFSEVSGLGMEFHAEELQQNGLFHGVVGPAQFQGGCNGNTSDLCVTTTGGEAAGVQIDIVSSGFRPERRLNMNLAPLDLAGTQGGVLRVRGLGVVNGVRGSLLGEVQVTQGASGHPVEVNFGTIANTARITVLRNGERVGSITAPVGQLGVIQGNAPMVGLGWATFPSSVRARFGGVASVAGMSGDEFVISAETAQPPVVGLESVFVLGSNLPGFTVTGETLQVRPPTIAPVVQGSGANTTLRLRVPTESGGIYQVQSRASLNHSWSDAFLINGNDAVAEYIISPRDAASGFFRIVSPRDSYSGQFVD